MFEIASIRIVARVDMWQAHDKAKFCHPYGDILGDVDKEVNYPKKWHRLLAHAQMRAFY